MTNTLNLTIAEPWFSMIREGKKKEEYREIKPYYESKFYKTFISGFGTCEPEAGRRLRRLAVLGTKISPCEPNFCPRRSRRRDE